MLSAFGRVLQRHRNAQTAQRDHAWEKRERMAEVAGETVCARPGEIGVAQGAQAHLYGVFAGNAGRERQIFARQSHV